MSVRPKAKSALVTSRAPPFRTIPPELRLPLPEIWSVPPLSVVVPVELKLLFELSAKTPVPSMVRLAAPPPMSLATVSVPVPNWWTSNSAPDAPSVPLVIV